jgi:hypothetical protein
LFAPLQEIGILPRHIEANLYVPKLFAQAAFKKERRPPAAPKARLRHDAGPAPSPLGYSRTRQHPVLRRTAGAGSGTGSCRSGAARPVGRGPR